MDRVLIDRQRIADTYRLIRPHIRRTPVVEVAGADFGLDGVSVVFKLELLQHAGSFKPRGAFANLLMRDVPQAGVVAASGGNHGAAVAFAARKLGKPAKIFVPSVASAAKIDRIRGYGADLVITGEQYAEALEASQRWAAQSGAMPVHAYDQVETILGQGSVGLEFEEQDPALDTLLVAVGKTPWEHAMRLGRVEVARLLEEAGAPVAELDEVGRFVSMCMAGDERGARAMLERTPDLVNRAPKDMVHRAVWTKRAKAVKLALDLGFDPNWVEDNAAIHQAGELAENEGLLRMLLTHGASLVLRDPWYDGTAIGWADFFNYADLRERLLREPGICLFDALDYERLDRVPEILARDPEALERPFAKCLSRPPKPEDWQTPMVRMVVRGKTSAVRVLLEHGADAAARHPDGRSLEQVARDNGFDEIARLLKAQRRED